MPAQEIALRVVLVLGGAFIIATGLDFVLGGIASLFEGPRDFFTVTNQHAFDVRDSHVRFIGGVWLSLGLVFVAAAAWFAALKPALLSCIVFIFIGGLARLSTQQFDLLFGPEIAPSLAAELIGMPLLFLWARLTKPRAAKAPAPAV
jgi:hypothetical protein